MDIKIKSDEGNFKFRVAGLLEHNGKYLAVKIQDNTFYCLPGGHVELGESTDEAIIREMGEELGYPVKISRLMSVAQNFFTKDNKPFHEFSFYYLVNPENEKDVNPDNYIRMENDKGVMKKLEFAWLSKEDLDNVKFNPRFVKNMLSSNKVLNIVNRDDGECVIKEF